MMVYQLTLPQKNPIDSLMFDWTKLIFVIVSLMAVIMTILTLTKLLAHLPCIFVQLSKVALIGFLVRLFCPKIGLLGS